VAADLPHFDPRIIEDYVERTYRKATAVVVGSVTAGVLVGAVFGAMPLTSLGENWPIPRMFGFATMLVGALVGGVIGFTVGDARAFLCRLQGQTALAQVAAARNAYAALAAVRELQLEAAKQPAAPPAPVPEPEREPAPQPPELRVAVGSDLPLPPVSS
jgi:predicted lipid-binding transport protein (Tim44 family)